MWYFVCFEDNHMKTSIQKPATVVMSDEPLRSLQHVFVFVELHFIWQDGCEKQLHEVMSDT